MPQTAGGSPGRRRAGTGWSPVPRPARRGTVGSPSARGRGHRRGARLQRRVVGIDGQREPGVRLRCIRGPSRSASRRGSAASFDSERPHLRRRALEQPAAAQRHQAVGGEGGAERRRGNRRYGRRYGRAPRAPRPRRRRSRSRRPRRPAGPAAAAGARRPRRRSPWRRWPRPARRCPRYGRRGDGSARSRDSVQPRASSAARIGSASPTSTSAVAPEASSWTR